MPHSQITIPGSLRVEVQDLIDFFVQVDETFCPLSANTLITFKVPKVAESTQGVHFQNPSAYFPEVEWP